VAERRAAVGAMGSAMVGASVQRAQAYCGRRKKRRPQAPFSVETDAIGQRTVDTYSSLSPLTWNIEIAPPLMSPLSSKAIVPVTPG
jgi:hypothetical protein